MGKHTIGKSVRAALHQNGEWIGLSGTGRLTRRFGSGGDDDKFFVLNYSGKIVTLSIMTLDIIIDKHTNWRRGIRPRELYSTSMDVKGGMERESAVLQFLNTAESIIKIGSL